MKQRNLFAIIILLVLSGLSERQISAQAPKTEAAPKQTIVIVHGAWGGAWAFKNVEAMLTPV